MQITNGALTSDAPSAKFFLAKNATDQNATMQRNNSTVNGSQQTCIKKICNTIQTNKKFKG